MAATTNTMQPDNASLSQHSSQYPQGNAVPMTHPSNLPFAVLLPIPTMQSLPIPTYDFHAFHQYNYSTMNRYPATPLFMMPTPPHPHFVQASLPPYNVMSNSWLPPIQHMRPTWQDHNQNNRPVSKNTIPVATPSANPSTNLSATLPLDVSQKIECKRLTSEELHPEPQPASPFVETPTVVSPSTEKNSKLLKSFPKLNETKGDASKFVPAREVTKEVGSNSIADNSFSSTAVVSRSSVNSTYAAVVQNTTQKLHGITTRKSTSVSDNVKSVFTAKSGALSKPSQSSISQSVEKNLHAPKSTTSAKPAVRTSNVPSLPEQTLVKTTTASSTSTVKGTKSKKINGVSTRNLTLPTPSIVAAGSRESKSAPLAAITLSTGSGAVEKLSAGAAEPLAKSVTSQVPSLRTVTPIGIQSSAYFEDLCNEKEKVNLPPKQRRNGNDDANASDIQISGSKKKSATKNSLSTAKKSQQSTANSSNACESNEKTRRNKTNSKNSEADIVDRCASVEETCPRCREEAKKTKKQREEMTEFFDKFETLFWQLQLKACVVNVGEAAANLLDGSTKSKPMHAIDDDFSEDSEASSPSSSIASPLRKTNSKKSGSRGKKKNKYPADYVVLLNGLKGSRNIVAHKMT